MGEKDSGDKPDLDEELDRLQARLPHRVSRFMKKARSPEVAPDRILDGAARACRAGAGRAGDAPAAGAAVVEGQRQAKATGFYAAVIPNR